MKSQCWGSDSMLLGAGIRLEGFFPQKNEEQGILCWTTSSKCNILKMRFSALPPSVWAKWVSGWGGHLVSPILDFSGVLLDHQAPHFWRISCAVSHLPVWAQKHRVKFLQSLTPLVCKLLFPLKIKLWCNCSFALLSIKSLMYKCLPSPELFGSPEIPTKPQRSQLLHGFSCPWRVNHTMSFFFFFKAGRISCSQK